MTVGKIKLCSISSHATHGNSLQLKPFIQKGGCLYLLRIETHRVSEKSIESKTGYHKKYISFNDTTFFTNEEFNLALPLACTFNSELDIPEIRSGWHDASIIMFMIII